MLRKCIGIVLVVAFAPGCGSVNVIKDPGPGQAGIRYYRPKPYLLVTPADPTGRMVKIETKYLPDFSEEYALRIRGNGAAKLKDGWNLVEVSAGGKNPPPPAPPEPPAAPENVAGAEVPDMVVAGTNVPIGYYESVFGEVEGRKFLKGWQYVGFSVMGGASPPVPSMVSGNGGNGQGVSCPHGRNGNIPCQPNEYGVPACMDNGLGMYEVEPPLFGLVMINGVMTFRMIDEIAMNQVCPSYVTVPKPEPPVSQEIPVDRDSDVRTDSEPTDPATDVRVSPEVPEPSIPNTPQSSYEVPRSDIPPPVIPTYFPQ